LHNVEAYQIIINLVFLNREIHEAFLFKQ
jgi:hypothetical protein